MSRKITCDKKGCDAVANVDNPYSVPPKWIILKVTVTPTSQQVDLCFCPDCAAKARLTEVFSKSSASPADKFVESLATLVEELIENRLS